MATRADRIATKNAVGQGRISTKENAELKVELVTEIPQPEKDLLNEIALGYWKKVCQILINRKILKPAHYVDLANWSNSQAYIEMLDTKILSVQAEYFNGQYEDDKQRQGLITELERLTKLRKIHLDATLTIGSRFGLDALSEKRFSQNVQVANTTVKANPFMKLDS